MNLYDRLKDEHKGLIDEGLKREMKHHSQYFTECPVGLSLRIHMSILDTPYTVLDFYTLF
jgi:hypothetical protein